MCENVKTFENYGNECSCCYGSGDMKCPDCYGEGNNDNCKTCEGVGYCACDRCTCKECKCVECKCEK
jgi:hypothetical protein